MNTPRFISVIRRDICQRCSAPCEAYHAGTIDFADAASTCPLGQWAPVHTAATIERQPVSPQPQVAWPDAWLDLFRRIWGELHKRALRVTGPDDLWLRQFGRQLPCGECKRHWLEMVTRTPPDWSNYLGWTVDRHNEVNRRLGKPELTITDARVRWGGTP